MSPRSGHFVPTPQLFVSAHTTQFVAIGWRYLPVGSGSGLLKRAGSYVSLVHPTDPSTLTVVIEKMSWEGSESAWQTLGKYETAAETLTLQLGAAFAHRKLALWKSTLRADDPSVDAMLIKQPEVTADATGTVSLAICVDCLFTLTTQLEAGVKGVVPAAPKPAPFRALLDIAEHFVGPDIALFQTHWIAKPPGDGMPVLYHQDGAYWETERGWGGGRDPMITVRVIADDEDEENGCMKVCSSILRVARVDTATASERICSGRCCRALISSRSTKSMRRGEE